MLSFSVKWAKSLPQKWLSMMILVDGFKQFLRQTWDYKNMHTYTLLRTILRVTVSRTQDGKRGYGILIAPKIDFMRSWL